ncbi:MAG: CoA transferase [Chloroflexota bacterium]
MESSTRENSHQTLDGIKVLDWAELAAGPYCAKMLADLGAETVKIEKPGVGDPARYRGPFVHNEANPENSLLFLYLNTNKRGITLDVESPAEREKFLKLVAWADIIIEDHSPQMLQQLKLTYADLQKVNPKLVMTSITPFGQTGPYRDYKAYPINTYHAGGWGYISPFVAGTERPIIPGGLFTECACGLTAGVATLAAFYHQRATGLGQQVDVSKQEAILSFVRVQADRYPNEGSVQSRLDPIKGASGVFDCQDGFVTLVTVQAHEWQNLFKFISNGDVTKFGKYADETYRQQHLPEITQLVADWLRNHNRFEVYHQGQAAGCPMAPVTTAKDVAESPQLKARQFFAEATHPVAGKLAYPGVAYALSATPFVMRRTAPSLGQHNEEIFSQPLPVNRLASKASSRERPLAGIRIADFCWAWAGSHATELLASLGAEVIKIESAHHIDYTRILAFTTDQKFSGVNQSRVFNDLNLGKKSITLNLSQPKAIELVKKLVSVSDIVSQNMRPGAMERLGLGYEDLCTIKPDIIYLASSSHGAVGPERGYAGYAPIFAALGGITYVSGLPGGKPASHSGEMDLVSAVTSSFAILAALTHRFKTGEGQYIDMSSSASISVLMGEFIMEYMANGRVPGGQGNRDEKMAPHNSYRCQGNDKWVSIAVATDEEWQALCRVIGNPGWTGESRFATACARWQNQAELDELIEQWTVNHSPDEVMEMLQKVGVAAVPCFNGEEIFKNPHLQYRQNWAKVNHPVIGEQKVLIPPWKFSATPVRIDAAAPLLGQDNDYIFKELLGLAEDEYRQLVEEKVIY